MTTFVDLLRAVNVSGQNKLPMADLRSMMTAAGFADVQTYVQSGNIVCDGDGAGAGRAGAPERAGAAAERAGASAGSAGHAETVHDLISAAFGLDVVVVALTAPELAAAAAGNPFLAANPETDPKTLHVTFLSQAVEPAAFAGLSLPAAGDEAASLSADGRLIYLSLPSGYGRTKLTNAWFERALKVPATTRNWRTVLALRALAEAR